MVRFQVVEDSLFGACLSSNHTNKQSRSQPHSPGWARIQLFSFSPSNFDHFFSFFLKPFSFSSSFWLSGWATCPPGKALATPLLTNHHRVNLHQRHRCVFSIRIVNQEAKRQPQVTCSGTAQKPCEHVRERSIYAKIINTACQHEGMQSSSLLSSLPFCLQPSSSNIHSSEYESQCGRECLWPVTNDAKPFQPKRKSVFTCFERLRTGSGHCIVCLHKSSDGDRGHLNQDINLNQAINSSVRFPAPETFPAPVAYFLRRKHCQKIWNCFENLYFFTLLYLILSFKK